MATLIFMYFLLTSLICAIGYAINESDPDKAAAIFIYGLACGWIIVPIKIIKGIKKYMKGE